MLLLQLLLLFVTMVLAVETTEAWQIALENKTGPSVLALSRQGLPTLRTKHSARNLSAKGGYVLQEAEVGPRQVTLMATGSEVELAVNARAMLEKKKIGTAVVSMPSMELFAKQSAKYRDSVLGGQLQRFVGRNILFSVGNQKRSRSARE